MVEDVAICPGRPCEALGEKRGITRMADASVPMDESLAFVAVDLSGRGYSVLDMQFDDNDMSVFHRSRAPLWKHWLLKPK